MSLLSWFETRQTEARRTRGRSRHWVRPFSLHTTPANRNCRGLGHLAIQYSKAMGFKTVAVSTTGSKKDLALQLGADIFIDESTQDAVEELKKLGGADVVVGTAPSSTATMKMVDALAFQGTLLVLSLPAEPVPFLPSTPHLLPRTSSVYSRGDAQSLWSRSATRSPAPSLVRRKTVARPSSSPGNTTSGASYRSSRSRRRRRHSSTVRRRASGLSLFHEHCNVYFNPC